MYVGSLSACGAELYTVSELFWKWYKLYNVADDKLYNYTIELKASITTPGDSHMHSWKQLHF